MLVFIDWLHPDITTWILYGIAGALVLFIFILIIRRLFFYNRKNRKMIRDLRRKYDYIHNLLLNQDSAYMRRLESVANVNLLARPQFEEYQKRFAILRDKSDLVAQEALSKMAEAIQTKHKRQFKEVYSRQRPAVILYERDVLALNKELMAQIKPEEDARQAAVEKKEKFRELVDRYNNQRDELMLVEESFEKLFAGMDKIFAEYDKKVEIGSYEEAKDILNQIAKVLQSLEKTLTVLPELCLKASSLVPQKIDETERQFNELSQEGYPLHHIASRPLIDAMRADLNIIIAQIKTFELQGVNASLDKLSERNDEIVTSFAREIEQRHIFESEYDAVYKSVLDLEREFIRLANTMPNIQGVYSIDSQRLANLEDLKKKIDHVSLIKRTLDTFIHSSTRQPYSLLVEKMHNLSDETKATWTLIDEYRKYLENLKNDAENTFTLINALFYKLKAAEKSIRDIGLPRYGAEFSADFDHCYALISAINDLLHVRPIDLDAVNKDAALLQEKGEELLSRVEKDSNLAILAENAIVYANAYRADFSDVQAMLKQDEMSFSEGAFEQAYIDAGNILKRYRNNG